MKRLVVLGSDTHENLCKESTVDLYVLIPLIFNWLRACPGDVGRALMCAGRRLRARPSGLAVTSVFPVPFLPSPGYEGPGGFRCVSSMKYIPEILANLWVAFLNVAYLGQGVVSVIFSPLPHKVAFGNN